MSKLFNLDVVQQTAIALLELVEVDWKTSPEDSKVAKELISRVASNVELYNADIGAMVALPEMARLLSQGYEIREGILGNLPRQDGDSIIRELMAMVRDVSK
jgi:hypothetical protein